MLSKREAGLPGEGGRAGVSMGGCVRLGRFISGLRGSVSVPVRLPLVR